MSVEFDNFRVKFDNWAARAENGDVYRGLSCEKYDIKSSRHVAVDSDKTIDVRGYYSKNSIDIIENLIKNEKNNPVVAEFKDRHNLLFLAGLQHFGIPTCLIDFTTCPYTALWFACASMSDNDAKIINVSVDSYESVPLEEISQKIEKFLSGDHLWRWDCNDQILRGKAQKSVFLFGIDPITSFDQFPFDIPGSIKGEILRWLMDTKGIHYFSIYPDAVAGTPPSRSTIFDTNIDIDGYNSELSDNPNIEIADHLLGRTHKFFDLQSALEASGDYEKIVALCNKTIEDPEACENLGVYLLDVYFYRASSLVFSGKNNIQTAIKDLDYIIASQLENKTMKGFAYFEKAKFVAQIRDHNKQTVVYCFQEGINILPDTLSVRIDYCKYVYLHLDKSKALMMLREIQQKQPRSLVINFELSSMLFRDKKYDEALKFSKNFVNCVQSTSASFNAKTQGFFAHLLFIAKDSGILISNDLMVRAERGLLLGYTISPSLETCAYLIEFFHRCRRYSRAAEFADLAFQNFPPNFYILYFWFHSILSGGVSSRLKPLEICDLMEKFYPQNLISNYCGMLILHMEICALRFFPEAQKNYDINLKISDFKAKFSKFNSVVPPILKFINFNEYDNKDSRFKFLINSIPIVNSCYYNITNINLTREEFEKTIEQIVLLSKLPFDVY